MVLALRQRAATAAPDVDTSTLVLVDGTAVAATATRFTPSMTQRSITFNVPADELHAPVVGPAHPFTKDGVAAGLKNHTSGHVEDLHLNSVIFDEQYNRFHATSRAEAPGGDGRVVGAPEEPPAAKKRKTEARAMVRGVGVKRVQDKRES